MSTPCIDHGLSGNKPQGYHQLRVGGRLQYVHRVVFAEAQGLPVAELPLVRHLCHNPRCINPMHLATGTHQDNANDRVKAGRSAKTNPATRSLTEAQEVEVIRRYRIKTGKYCKQHGVMKLARDFGVSSQAIYGALRRGGAYAHRGS